MPAPNVVSSRISQLYRYTDADISQLEQTLLATRLDVWRDAITSELHAVGARGRSARSARGRDLRYLERISREDAESIAQTWNDWVIRRIDELYDANPRGNRYYYTKNLEGLARQRDSHHQRVIALNTDSTTRQYARQRFIEENDLSESFYEYAGASPVSDECKERFAAGTVDYNYIKAHPVPAHPRCPHEWQFAGTNATVNPAKLWAG